MLQRIIYWFTYLSLPYLYIRRFDPEGFSQLMLYMRTSMSFSRAGPSLSGNLSRISYWGPPSHLAESFALDDY